ncbi:MAG: hypothetical protein ACJ8EY_11050 [Sphingomicrobium sp.]
MLATAYGLVCLQMLIARRTSRDAGERAFWGGASLLLLFFAVAKATHLQGSISNWLRMTARGEGWYGSRATLQYAVLLLIILGVVLVVMKVRTSPRRPKPNIVAAGATMVVLVGFILIRAASIHEIDPAMTRSFTGIPFGWWMELAFLAILAAITGSYIRNQAGRRSFSSGANDQPD